MLEMSLLYLKNDLSNSVLVGTVVRDGKNRISPRDSQLVVERGFVDRSKTVDKAHWYNFIGNIRKRHIWMREYSPEVEKLIATHGFIPLLSKNPGNHSLSGNLRIAADKVVQDTGTGFLREMGVPLRDNNSVYDYYPSYNYSSHNQLAALSLLACEQDGYVHHILSLLGAGSPPISGMGIKICREFFWRNPGYELSQKIGYNARICEAIGIVLFTQQRFPVLVGSKVQMFATVEKLSEYLSKIKDHGNYIVTYMDIPRNFLYVPTVEQSLEIAKVYFQDRNEIGVYDGIEVPDSSERLIRSLITNPTYSYFPSDIIGNVVAHATIAAGRRVDKIDISSDEAKKNSFLHCSGPTPMAFPLPLVRNLTYEHVMVPAPVIWDGLNGLYDLGMVKNISSPIYIDKNGNLASQIESLGIGYVQLSGGQRSLPAEKIGDLNNFIDSIHRACQNLKSVEIAEPLSEADMIEV